MKKSFYFALALTAGLFASCSSDDLSQAPQQQGFGVNENDAALIQVGVGNIAYTRGTGTVGISANAAGEETKHGKWAGQKFNLFMFKKGTFIPAQYPATEATETEEATPATDIYNNTEMTTDPETQTANYVVDDVIQYNYFPSSGSYNFWAYRADDAAEDPVGVATFDETTGEWTDNADQVVIPFEIDGSQDLMIAYADTVNDLARLQTKVADATMNRIYSAYAARRAVNPQLKFQHLLTRLNFYVIADVDSREVSTQATPTGIDGEQIGYSITNVTVKSLSTGNIIAAYKGGADAKPAQIINWTEDQPLATFQLRSRHTEPERAAIEMQKINPNATIAFTKTVEGNSYSVNGSIASFKPSEAEGSTVVYKYTADTDNFLDAETGELIATPDQTYSLEEAQDAGDAYVWIAWVKDGFHTDGVTKWNVSTLTCDESEDLLDHLTPVTPKWQGYVPAGDEMEWVVYEPHPNKYNWVEGAEVANPTFDLQVAPGDDTVGEENNTYKYTNPTTGDVTWYVLESIEYDTDDVDDVPEGFDPDTSEGVAGTILVDNTDPDHPVYYKYQAADAGEASAGNPVSTKVGEALLVAPADSYEVEFFYTYTRKLTSTEVKVEHDSAKITVKRAGGEAFEAGNSYKVTAKLYKVGAAELEPIQQEPWGDGENINSDLEEEEEGD